MSVAQEEEDNSAVVAFTIHTEPNDEGEINLHFWWATENNPTGMEYRNDYPTQAEAMRESAMLLLKINGDIH